jgi:hypothetical protein
LNRSQKRILAKGTALKAWLIPALALAVLAGTAGQAAAETGNLVAVLTTSQEVPPTNTQASGEARITFNTDLNQLVCTLSVNNITDLTQAHFHVGKPGENGAVVLWLYPNAAPPVVKPGTTNGLLAAGSYNSSMLVGPMAGGNINDLARMLQNGQAYVNVHTVVNPGGEIRGQALNPTFDIRGVLGFLGLGR